MMLSLCTLCGFRGTVAEMLDHAETCLPPEVELCFCLEAPGFFGEAHRHS